MKPAEANLARARIDLLDAKRKHADARRRLIDGKAEAAHKFNATLRDLEDKVREMALLVESHEVDVQELEAVVERGCE